MSIYHYFEKSEKDKTSAPAAHSFVWTGSIHKSDFVALVRLNLGSSAERYVGDLLLITTKMY